MKSIIVAAIAVCLSSLAMGITPEQVGTYTGTIKSTLLLFDSKVKEVESWPAVMTIDEYGVCELAWESGNVRGEITLGSKYGILEHSVDYYITVKGRKLLGK